MAISKRKSCIGVKDGKRCRKWKNLSNLGYCEKCNPAPLDDADEDRCGMCPKNDSVITNVENRDEAVTDLTPEMIQCNLCEDWFHSACVGSLDYNKFIGNEEPVGVGHSKGGLAVHLWFCGLCFSNYTDLLKNLKESFKTSVLSPKENTDKPINISNGASKQVGFKADSAVDPSVILIESNPGDTVGYKPPNANVCKYYLKGKCRHG